MKNNRKLFALISSLVFPLLAACGGGDPGKEPSFYEKLYREDESIYHAPTSDSDIFKASDYYRDGTSPFWHYVGVQNGETSLVPYAGTKTSWEGCSFEADKLYLKQKALGFRFKAPKAGTAYLKAKIRVIEKTAQFSIQINENTELAPKEYAVNPVGHYIDIPVELASGDEVTFLAYSDDGAISMNPRIEFGEQEEVLYQKPNWGFYGDVHPFFHEGTMYMYNLEAHLEDPGNERYTWRLNVSKDFFNYQEIDYEVFPFVKDHYNATLDVYDSLFDKVTFPYGSRDMFLFYDSIAKRYVYFGLCYYEDMSSCLGYRQSDDDTGVHWSGPMQSMKDYAFANDPECSQAMLIGNRWYLITSLWGESIHSVGRLTYYIGEPGKAFLENDWRSAERHDLDGEDLCAGQLVNVGEDHYQMYGWIPKTSYSNDQEIYFNGTRNHGLWGGNINMPREVFQKENGELGSRLDEKAASLLNRGLLLEETNDLQGSYSSSLRLPTRAYISTILKQNDAKTASIVLNSDGKEYKVSLIEEGDAMRMQIGCAQETGHPVASGRLISKSEDGIYEIQLLADRSQFEFFVNHEEALTARTSMWGDEFTIGLESTDNKATFSNLQVSKLAHQGDVYDN